MRESKRDLILDAASRVVQTDGVTALSYESVAAASGLTKGGLLYHFPSREKLLLALHEYVAGAWEAELEREAGGPADQISDAERLGAYIRLSQTPDRAELLLMLEATEDPQAHAIWGAVYARWCPPAPSAAAGTDSRSVPVSGTGAEPATDTAPSSEHPAEVETDAFIARLAADGLWFYEALAAQRLEPGARQRVVRRISQWCSLTRDHEAAAAPGTE